MLSQACILVVDDESAIRLFLSAELAEAGYSVLMAASGEEALIKLQQHDVDLILLDLRMGGMSGLQLLKEVRQRTMPPAVIILTAYASLDSAISALRQGATDYLIKPCTPDDLLASVSQGLAQHTQNLRRQALVQAIEENVLQLRTLDQHKERKATQSDAPRFSEARGLLLDRKQLLVKRRGEFLDLTLTEFRLLACLMERANRPVSFAEMYFVLNGSTEIEALARQALNSHLWRLRRKLGKDPDGRDYIVNVRGRGYKFMS